MYPKDFSEQVLWGLIYHFFLYLPSALISGRLYCACDSNSLNLTLVLIFQNKISFSLPTGSKVVGD